VNVCIYYEALAWRLRVENLGILRYPWAISVVVIVLFLGRVFKQASMRYHSDREIHMYYDIMFYFVMILDQDV